MRNYEEAVENAKCQSRQREEVHCGDGVTMIARKCRPKFGWLGIPWRFPHPTQHGALRNILAKHFQLPMNT
jgi:hypothetical protein